MLIYNEDDQYEQFGSHRNQLLLRVAAEKAADNGLLFNLSALPNNEFQMLLTWERPTHHPNFTSVVDNLGKVLEDVLMDFFGGVLGDHYHVHSRCTFYGVDVSDQESLMWVTDADRKRGYWTRTGQEWSANRINEVEVPIDSLFENPVTGQLLCWPYAGQAPAGVLMVLHTDHQVQINPGVKMMVRHRPEWVL